MTSYKADGYFTFLVVSPCLGIVRDSQESRMDSRNSVIVTTTDRLSISLLVFRVVRRKENTCKKSIIHWLGNCAGIFVSCSLVWKCVYFSMGHSVCFQVLKKDFAKNHHSLPYLKSRVWLSIIANFHSEGFGFK